MTHGKYTLFLMAALGMWIVVCGCATHMGSGILSDDTCAVLSRSIEMLDANRVLLDGAITRARLAQDWSGSRALECAYVDVSEALGCIQWLEDVTSGLAADGAIIDQRRQDATNRYVVGDDFIEKFRINGIEGLTDVGAPATNVFATLSAPRDPLAGSITVVLRNESSNPVAVSRRAFTSGISSLNVSDVVGHGVARVPSDEHAVGDLNKWSESERRKMQEGIEYNLRQVPASLRDEMRKATDRDILTLLPNSQEQFEVRLNGFWLRDGTYHIRTRFFASNTLVVTLTRR